MLFYRLLCKLLTAVILVSWVSACSSTDQKSDEDDLQVSGDEQSNSKTTDEPGNQIADAEPVGDDGYDNDWNNMDTQQQQKQQAVANTNLNQQAQGDDSENSAEFGLDNGPAEQQEVAQEEPSQDYSNQVVNEEVPFEQQAEEAPDADYEQAVTEVDEAPASMGEVPIGGPLLRNEILAEHANLWWVGYDYAPNDSVVRLEIVTRGSPNYNIFQERNQADQPELVIRFFNTKLRKKVSRDIDASEFKSPVAFVRVRQDEEEGNVDVIMTLRDSVRPRMYARNGNLLLTFPIPDHYFGNSTIGDAPVAEADILPEANIMPEIDQLSAIPEGIKVARAYVPNPGRVAFEDAPDNGGEEVETEIVSNETVQYDEQGLPDDFENASLNENMNTEESDGNVFENQQGLDNANYGNNNAEYGNENYEDNASNSNANYGADTPQTAPQAISAPPAEAQPDNQENYNNQQDEDYQMNQQEGLEGEESLDDFDDGEGESEEEIDKFDVRVEPQGNKYKIVSFSLKGVAQDDNYGDDYDDGDDYGDENSDSEVEQGDDQGNQGDYNQGNQGDYNQGNQSDYNQGNQGNYTQGDLGNPGNQASQGNQGNSQQGEDFPGANQGDNDYGNQSPPEDNFGGNLNAEGNENFDAELSESNNTENGAAFNQASNLGDYARDEAVFDDASADLAGDELEGSDSADAPEEEANDGKPISMDFRGAPLREVIRMLSEESGINFVLSPKIQERKVYLSFNNVSFNTALQALLKSNSLGLVEIGPGLVRIDTLENIANDEKKMENARKAQALATPTQVLVLRLSFAKAEDAKAMLKPMLTKVADGDDRITVQIDARTNSLIVNAKPNEIAMVKTLIERIDLETPQVKIASRIVEVNKTFKNSFGISWDSGLNLDQGRGLGFGNLVYPNSMISGYSVDAGGRNPGAANYGFTFGAINNVTGLDLALSMEENKGTTELLQSSNLIVQDNEEAKITAGRSDFFKPPQAGAGQTGDIELIELTYNLEMSVTPHITADGSIQMKLEISSDTPTNANSAAAVGAKNNRHINTTLLRRSGQTAVIGGIYNTTKTHAEKSVPFFSSIPIIGALFRSSQDDELRREMLVMVTPTILSGGTTAGDSASVGGDDYNTANDAAPGGQDGQYNQQNFSGEQGNYGLNANGQQNSGNANFQQNAAAANQGEGGDYNLSGNQALNGQQSNQQQANQQQGNQQQGNQQQGNQQNSQGNYGGGNQQQGNAQGNGQQATNQQGGDYENF